MAIYTTHYLPDRTITLENGQEYLWFSGTDYLGMANDEIFRSLLNQGISKLGTHFGSSRNNSLQLTIYTEAENELAHFAQAPAALTVSSGMWAGQLVMKEIENIIATNHPALHRFQYHYAPGVHPAIRGNNYVPAGPDWDQWAQQTLVKINDSPTHTAHIICTDSIGSPMVQSFDFSVFNGLSNPNVWFIADDSHGIGVTGTTGGGIYQKLSFLPNLHVIVCASLNKGMGIPAGAIFAGQHVIDLLTKSSWYAGASPCPPAYCFVLKQLLMARTYAQAYHQLKNNIGYFQKLIPQSRLFTSIEDYPVFCSKNPQLFQYLLNNGVMGSCFPYPSPTDEPITRLAIHARHIKKDLDQLAEVSIQFQKDYQS